MAGLFISYSRDDLDAARRLTESFQGQDLEFWIDWQGIQPTEDWWKAIEKGIEEADVFLFLLSPDSSTSRVCRQEIEHAARNGKRLIPVVVRDIQSEDCPPELRHLNWIFLREQDDFSLGYQKIITAVKTDYVWVQVHRQLQVKALEWDRTHRETSLLLRGKELQDAELQLATNSSKQPYPTDLQREYVLRSRQVSDDQRFRNATIATAAIIVLAVLTVVAIVQSGVAREAQAIAESNAAAAQTAESHAVANAAIAGTEASQRATAQYKAEENEQLAKKRALIALARQLEAQALDFESRRTDRSLLLTLEAMRIAPSDARSSTLLKVMESNPRLRSYLHPQQAGLREVAFDSTGSRFATGSLDGIILLWDSTTLEQVQEFSTGPVESLIFGPGAELLATGDRAGTVNLWEVATGEMIHSFHQNARSIQSLAFSADGHVLAAGSADGTISLWNVDTLEPLFPPLQGHPTLVGSLAFSRDGNMLASGDDGGNIYLWDVSNASALYVWMDAQTSWITSLAFSPDGKTLVSGSGDHTIFLWDVQGYAKIGEFLRHGSWVHSLAFSSDGRILASAGQDGLVVLWDMNTGQAIDQPLRGHLHGVYSLAFHPDNQTLISGGDDAVIKWAINGFTRIGQILTEDTTRIFGLAFSPDGKLLASGDLYDGGIAIWDVEQQQQIGPLLAGHEGRIRSLAFSPTGNVLASSGDDRKVIVWDIQSHEQLVRLEGHSNQVLSVAFSPDGKLLASGSKDYSIILWSMDTYQPVMKLENGHVFWVTTVAFSPDGQWLASGGWDRTIWLWDLSTGQGTRLLRDRLDLVSAVTFRRDGKQLAAGGFPGEVYLWDLPQRTPIQEPLTGHQSSVTQLVYNPDPPYLASGANDGQVILWDLTNLEVFAQFPVSLGAISSVAFSPDGKTLVAGSCDGSGSLALCSAGKIVLWDLDSSTWDERVCAIVGRNLSQREWRAYLLDQPYHATCPQWPAGE